MSTTSVKVKRSRNFRKRDEFYNNGQLFQCIYVSAVLNGEVFMVVDALTGRDMRYDLKFYANDMLALDKASDQHRTPLSMEESIGA